MNLLVSVDRNWNIGYRGDLLLRIPEDMRYFKALTTGNVIVMGRKTFESLPGSKALPNRTNIVISSTLNSNREDIFVCENLDRLLKCLHEYDSEKIFIIGGEAIFKQLLPFCDLAYVTAIEHEFDADTSMPNLDEDPAWEITERSELHYHQDIPYRFMVYKRKDALGKM